MGRQTTLVHAGEKLEVKGSTSLTTPIYATSTFVFDSAAEVEAYGAGQHEAFLYSRYENPTVVAVEAKLAALDQAEAALLFGSGMAAISTALLGLLEAGDEVVCSAAIYGGTFHLLEGVLPKFGIVPRFVDLSGLIGPELFTPRSRVLWFESPINPTLRCVDVAAVAAACRQAGVVSVIDNTFASPINQQPLALGVDLAMQSATKYLNGHSDVTAGVLTGSRERIAPLSRLRRLLGAVLDPQPAYALGRGMKTMGLRVGQQNATALALAEALESDPRVDRVFYPGLSSHPDHAIARQQMSGFGGMVCVNLKGGQERAVRTFDKLKLFARAASLGGAESLCSLPFLTSQFGLSDEELESAGVSRGMLRLSIGLEDGEDLLADLRQALD